MGSTHIADMYKAKHPSEFVEKFPQKKKKAEVDNLSPSERIRLEELKEQKEPKSEAEKRAEARERIKAKKEEEKKK